MIPLKVTFLFGSPVVTDCEFPVHLDALLAWCRVQEASEMGVRNALKVGHDDLPLAKAGEDDSWVWQASRLFFTQSAPRQIVNMQRKSSPEKFYADFDDGFWINGKKNPPTINTQSGQYRAYQFYVAIQWMACATAFCVGDPDRVRVLLNRLEHVGKMGRNGFGILSGFTVVPANSIDADKWRLRVLPSCVEGVEGVTYAPVVAPVRPPYWDKSKRVVGLREPVV